MTRLSTLRFAVAATIVLTSFGAATLASPKSAATMTKAAAQFLDSLSADQKAKAVLPFDSESAALALHPERDVPAQGADDQGDERGAAPPRP